MKVKKFLTKRRWTKGAVALTKRGRTCSTSCRWATKFCLIGAVRKCYHELEERRNVLSRIAAALNNTNGIAGFNDHPSTTFEQVKALVVKLDV